MIKKDLLTLMNTSEPGQLGLFKDTFTYFNDYKYKYDENGNTIETEYLCSYIVSMRKYGNTLYNIAYINLDKTYHGQKINIDDMQYDWRYLTCSMEDFKDIYITESWKEFKK